MFHQKNEMSKSVKRKHRKSHRQHRGLELLESRILFVTYTWTGDGAADTNFNTNANWGGTGHPVAGDIAIVGQNATIAVTADVTVGAIQIKGNAGANVLVTFEIGAEKKLTLTATGGAVDGNFTIFKAAGKTTDLKIIGGGSTVNKETVVAKGIVIKKGVANPADIAGFTAEGGNGQPAIMTFSDPLKFDGTYFSFDVEDYADVRVGGLSLLGFGGDAANNLPSYLRVYGSNAYLKSNGAVNIGSDAGPSKGEGTADTEILAGGHLEGLGNGQDFSIGSSSTFYMAYNSYLTNWSTSVISRNRFDYTSFEVDQSTVNGSLFTTVGQGMVDVSFTYASSIVLDILEIDTSQFAAVTFDGPVSNGASIGFIQISGFNREYPAGLYLENGVQVTTLELTVAAKTKNLVDLSPFPQLTVTGGSVLQTNRVYFGTESTPAANQIYTANICIGDDDEDASMITLPEVQGGGGSYAFKIGNDPAIEFGRTRLTIYESAELRGWATEITKQPGAEIIGEGLIRTNKITSPAKNADFMPGSLDSASPYYDPFGDIKIDGDLDASGGTTLRINIGAGSGNYTTSGDSSSLDVTGNVTLCPATSSEVFGDLYVTALSSDTQHHFANSVINTSTYSNFTGSLFDSFTVLSSDNLIDGEFTNMPDEEIITDLVALSKLPNFDEKDAPWYNPGRTWFIDYNYWNEDTD